MLFKLLQLEVDNEVICYLSYYSCRLITRNKQNISLQRSRCAVTLMTSKICCTEAVVVFNVALG